MGETVWWTLSTDSQAKVDAITKKWEEKYKPELDLARIPHEFKRIEQKCRFVFQKMRIPLEMERIHTYADLENKVSQGRIKLLTKMPSMQEFINFVYPGPKFFVVEVPFNRDLREFLESRLNIEKFGVTWIYPGVYFSPPQPRDVEGVDYIHVPCKGFYQNAADVETIAFVFAQILPNKFYCCDLCKTQPGSHEEVQNNSFVHMLLCDFLADVEKEGLAKVHVKDEADYYKTHDLNVLLKNFGAGYAVIERVGKALKEAGWKR